MIHIPASAAPFFQEYDASRLDVRRHAALIIERILAYGSRAEVRWLLATYGRQAVRDWVAQVGSQRLPWRRFTFWLPRFLAFWLPRSPWEPLLDAQRRVRISTPRQSVEEGVPTPERGNQRKRRRGEDPPGRDAPQYI